MTSQYAYATCIIIILICTIAGCVAPPKESPVSQTSSGTPYGSSSPSGNPVVSATPTPSVNYLTDATPFQTPVTPTLGFHTWVPTPTISEDQICLIYFTKLNATFAVTKTAKSFDLKNPPMYINYSIIDPYYSTGTRQSRSSTVGSVSFKELNPVAYLEITARNRTSGEIYTRDGFGKGYGQYLNKTIKITKPDDLLIEIGGYNVTSTIGIWAKPIGNFGENETFTKTECKYASEFGPNKL
jgi:hypothetical protein